MARLRRKARRASATGAPRVVVVGLGFAGLATVKGLTQAGMQVTLLDRNIYSTFQPLLYQVATGGLNPSDVAYPLRGFARRYGASFRRGELAGIDPGARRVTLADGGQLSYEYLVLATGVAAAYYGVTGADKYSFGLYTRHDAIALRDRIMAGLERLSAADRSEQVSVTVVGGGATGVELSGALAELRATVLDATFPDVDPARVEQAPGRLGGQRRRRRRGYDQPVPMPA